MKICIAGKNSIAVNILHFILANTDHKQNIFVIPNKNDQGIDGWQPSLKKASSDQGIKIVSLEEIYSIPDLVFLSLEFDRLIKPNLFWSKKLYNIHFSLLPKYKGMYTSAWPILLGERQTGVTLHEIDAGIDTGDIIDQRIIEIDFADTARDLYHKYLIQGENLIYDNWDFLLKGTYTATKQTINGSTYFSKKSINYQNLSVDTNVTGFQLHNQIRAFTFKEFQMPRLFSKPVLKSVPLAKKSETGPGYLLAEDKEGFIVSTIDYDVHCYTEVNSLFWQAFDNNDINCLNRLISNADLHSVRTKEGWSPLMIAAYRYNKEIVKILIKHGFNINDTNAKGTTVLMYAKDGAVRVNDISILADLLQAGADINARDNEGKTVLQYCLETNVKQDIIQFLMKNGAIQ